MGIFDRVRGMWSGADDDNPAEPPVDFAERKVQLNELETALRTLASAMAAHDDRMANPGWRGRVEDLRFAANEASKLASSEFDRTALLDLAAEVRPLYRDVPPPEYAPYRDEHDRVMAAAAALRGQLPSES